jgi:hypothetical protein
MLTGNRRAQYLFGFLNGHGFGWGMTAVKRLR